jgi:hypothetical protein
VTVQCVAPQRRCDAATDRCDIVSAGSVETGNGVVDEKADSVGSAVLVGTCGAFVAAFRKRAEIFLADVNRQSSKTAARPFPATGRPTLEDGCGPDGDPPRQSNRALQYPRN